MDIFVGGVKERPIAYKLGVGFCDHNHERKEALEGFVGMLNFAREVYATVMSPVWRFVPRKSGAGGQELLKGRTAHENVLETPYVSTTNACKLCAPLGACLAFRGIEGAVPFLHGSQGCATYMRRYLISHFREPMDIASSSLGEKHAVFGGGPNLKQGITNVMHKYGAADHRRGDHLSHRNHRRRRARDLSVNSARSMQRSAPTRPSIVTRLHAQLFGHPHGRLPCRGQGGGGAAGRRAASPRSAVNSCRASFPPRTSAI